MTHGRPGLAKAMYTMITALLGNLTALRAARSVALLFALLASGAPALAQWTPFSTPKYEVSGAFSYVRAHGANSGSFNLVGGSGEFTYHFRHWLAVTADGGAYQFRGLPAEIKSTMYTYTAGPRLNLRKHRVTFFAQTLVGGGRLTASSGGVDAAENGLVVLAGAGVDLPISHGFAIRAGQAEYMLTKFASNSGASASQNSLRLSFGVVFRFGDR